MMRKMKCKYYVVLVLALLILSDYCGVFKYFQQLNTMAMRVVEFSNGGYKIEKIFA